MFSRWFGVAFTRVSDCFPNGSIRVGSPPWTGISVVEVLASRVKKVGPFWLPDAAARGDIPGVLIWGSSSGLISVFAFVLVFGFCRRLTGR